MDHSPGQAALDAHDGQHVHGTSVGAGHVPGLRAHTSGHRWFSDSMARPRCHIITCRRSEVAHKWQGGKEGRRQVSLRAKVGRYGVQAAQRQRFRNQTRAPGDPPPCSSIRGTESDKDSQARGRGARIRHCRWSRVGGFRRHAASRSVCAAGCVRVQSVARTSKAATPLKSCHQRAAGGHTQMSLKKHRARALHIGKRGLIKVNAYQLPSE